MTVPTQPPLIALQFTDKDGNIDWPAIAKVCEERDALLAAPSWKLVPEEPTRAMLMAIMGYPLVLATSDEVVGREVYRRMLAAVPGKR